MTQLVKAIGVSMVLSAGCAMAQGSGLQEGLATSPGVAVAPIDIEASLGAARIVGFGVQIELVVPLPMTDEARQIGAIGRQITYKGVCGQDGAPATPEILFEHARRDLERMNNPQRGTSTLVFGESPRFVVSYDPLDPLVLALFMPGFERAALFVDAVVDDRVDINIDLRTADLPGNVIGSAGSVAYLFDYDAYVRGLMASSTRLPLVPFTPLFSSFLPLGSLPVRYDGSATNTAETQVVVNATQIRAIFGNNALSPNTDILITLDSTSQWDYFSFINWTVVPGSLSLIDVAVHEITHGMGFASQMAAGGGNPLNRIAGLDVARFKFTGGQGFPGSPPVTLEQFRDLPRHGENTVFTDPNVYARPGEGTMVYIELEGGDFAGNNLLQPSHLAYKQNFGDKLGMMDPVLATGATRGPAFWSVNDRGPIDDMGWKLINPVDLGGDCNGNGFPDIVDIVVNGFRDADNDGRLDICETFYAGVSNAGSRPNSLTETVLNSSGVAVFRFQVSSADRDYDTSAPGTTRQLSGFIFAPQPDEYAFRIQNSSFSELTIAGQRIIQNGGGALTDLFPLSVPGYIQLEAGWHPFVMTVVIASPGPVRLTREARSLGGWGPVPGTQLSGSSFPDCNENGRDDAFDFDSDGNGIPDVCEDCDGDEIPDGVEFDRNNNGIPDDCEPRDVSNAPHVGVAGTDAESLEYGTCNSPAGFRFDTEIAIWSADGTLIATNDDADGCAASLLSRLDLVLPAGEYVIGLCGFNGVFADNFFVTFATSFRSGSYRLGVGNAPSVVDSVLEGEVKFARFTIEQEASCPADLAAPFGSLNFFDVLAYLNAFNSGNPTADLASPIGTLNFFDVLAYLAAFNAGCP